MGSGRTDRRMRLVRGAPRTRRRTSAAQWVGLFLLAVWRPLATADAHAHAHNEAAAMAAIHAHWHADAEDALEPFACGVGHPALAHLGEEQPLTRPVAYASPATRGDAGDTPASPVQADRLKRVPLGGLDQSSSLPEARGRGLASGNASTFVSIDDADAQNATAALRVGLHWGALEWGDLGVAAGDDGGRARQCSRVNEVIDVACSAGSGLGDGAGICEHVCRAEDLVGPDAGRSRVVRIAMTWVRAFLRALLRVKPAEDAIVLDPQILSDFRLNATHHGEFSDVDLVVLVTARPVVGARVAGYARCLQTDQFQRCTVGHLNFVPAALPAQPPTTLERLVGIRHTALHEMVHILSRGLQPSNTFISNVTGDPMPADQVYRVLARESDAFPRPVTRIVTPRVQALVRSHFDCSSIDGMNLEDQPGGRLAHWEARLMGSELMSYGTGSGEVFLSDLTVAFLEDTNQYRANYSLAGPLVGRSVTEEIEGGLSFVDPTTTPGVNDDEASTGGDDDDDDAGGGSALFASSSNDAVSSSSGGLFGPFLGGPVQDSSVTPIVRPPGALRWGKGEGCSFVTGSPTQWSERYQCSRQGDFGCSPDNRMSAVCVIHDDWSLPSSRVASCGEFIPGSTSSCDGIPNDNCAAGGGGCGLPTMFQYFPGSGAQRASGSQFATPGMTGGFSSAMDYAPVRVGFWSCQDAGAFEVANGSLFLAGDAVEDNSKTSAVSSLASTGADDIARFGGQTRCDDCRCFRSSLRELNRNFDPSFTEYGLCYRANCYKEDHLQIAIRSILGNDVTWYGCPSAGGVLTIPGFTGSFLCPPAREFCRFEAITGIYFPETEPWWEWALWGALIGLPVLLVALCTCVPAFREAVVRRGKKCCGVADFVLLGPMDPRDRFALLRDIIDMANEEMQVDAEVERDRLEAEAAAKAAIPDVFRNLRIDNPPPLLNTPGFPLLPELPPLPPFGFFPGLPSSSGATVAFGNVPTPLAPAPAPFGGPGGAAIPGAAGRDRRHSIQHTGNGGPQRRADPFALVLPPEPSLVGTGSSAVPRFPTLGSMDPMAVQAFYSAGALPPGPAAAPGPRVHGHPGGPIVPSDGAHPPRERRTSAAARLVSATRAVAATVALGKGSSGGGSGAREGGGVVGAGRAAGSGAGGSSLGAPHRAPAAPTIALPVSTGGAAPLAIAIPTSPVLSAPAHAPLPGVHGPPLTMPASLPLHHVQGTQPTSSPAAPTTTTASTAVASAASATAAPPPDATKRPRRRSEWAVNYLHSRSMAKLAVTTLNDLERKKPTDTGSKPAPAPAATPGAAPAPATSTSASAAASAAVGSLVARPAVAAPATSRPAPRLSLPGAAAAAAAFAPKAPLTTRAPFKPVAVSGERRPGAALDLATTRPGPPPRGRLSAGDGEVEKPMRRLDTLRRMRSNDSKTMSAALQEGSRASSGRGSGSTASALAGGPAGLGGPGGPRVSQDRSSGRHFVFPPTDPTGAVEDGPHADERSPRAPRVAEWDVHSPVERGREKPPTGHKGSPVSSLFEDAVHSSHPAAGALVTGAAPAGGVSPAGPRAPRAPLSEAAKKRAQYRWRLLRVNMRRLARFFETNPEAWLDDLDAEEVDDPELDGLVDEQVEESPEMPARPGLASFRQSPSHMASKPSMGGKRASMGGKRASMGGKRASMGGKRASMGGKRATFMFMSPEEVEAEELRRAWESRNCWERLQDDCAIGCRQVQAWFGMGDFTDVKIEDVLETRGEVLTDAWGANHNASMVALPKSKGMFGSMSSMADLRRAKEREDERKRRQKSKRRKGLVLIQRSASRVMTVVSSIVVGLGATVLVYAGALAGAGNLTSLPLFAIGSWSVLLGLLGLYAARKAAEVASCVAVVYFVLNALVLLVLAIVTVWIFVLESSLTDAILDQWSFLSQVVPPSLYSSGSATDVVGNATTNGTAAGTAEADARTDAATVARLVTENVWALGLALAVFSALTLAGLVSSARLLSVSVVTGALFRMFSGYAGLVLAPLIVLLAVWDFLYIGRVAGAVLVTLLVGLSGTSLWIVSLLATLAGCKKHRTLATAVMLTAFLTQGLHIWGFYECLTRAWSAEADVAALPTRDLLLYAGDLGLEARAGSAARIERLRAAIGSAVADNWRMLALAELTAMLLTLITVAAARMYLRALDAVARLLTPDGIKRARTMARAAMVIRKMLEGRSYSFELTSGAAPGPAPAVVPAPSSAAAPSSAPAPALVSVAASGAGPSTQAIDARAEPAAGASRGPVLGVEGSAGAERKRDGALETRTADSVGIATRRPFAGAARTNAAKPVVSPATTRVPFQGVGLVPAREEGEDGEDDDEVRIVGTDDPFVTSAPAGGAGRRASASTAQAEKREVAEGVSSAPLPGAAVDLRGAGMTTEPARRISAVASQPAVSAAARGSVSAGAAATAAATAAAAVTKSPSAARSSVAGVAPESRRHSTAAPGAAPGAAPPSVAPAASPSTARPAAGAHTTMTNTAASPRPLPAPPGRGEAPTSILELELADEVKDGGAVRAAAWATRGAGAAFPPGGDSDPHLSGSLARAMGQGASALGAASRPDATRFGGAPAPAPSPSHRAPAPAPTPAPTSASAPRAAPPSSSVPSSTSSSSSSSSSSSRAAPATTAAAVRTTRASHVDELLGEVETAVRGDGARPIGIHARRGPAAVESRPGVAARTQEILAARRAAGEDDDFLLSLGYRG